MVAQERLHRIMEYLERVGAARISELAAHFGVSDMTVHRDLRKLGEQGIITKVHGGAVAKRVTEIPYRDRKVHAHIEKEAVARMAASLVAPGMTIYLSPGTTITEMAKVLSKEGLRIVTNSLPIAEALTLSSGHEIMLTGGTVRRYAEALVGPAAERMLAGQFFHLTFIAVTGIDIENGLTVYSDSEAQVLRTAIRSARKTVLLTDSSKFDKVMGPVVTPLEAVHVLISDPGIPEKYRDYLAAHDVQLVLAPVAEACGKE